MSAFYGGGEWGGWVDRLRGVGGVPGMGVQD